MQLFGSSFSPFVRKVMTYAAERGIDYDLVETAPASEDSLFRETSPLGTIPGFRDGDFTLSDSTAIIAYLERKFPDGALDQPEPESHARIIWWEEYADTVMSPVVFKCFWNRVVAPLMLGVKGNDALAEEGETVDLPKVLDFLEGQLPQDGGFLVGGQLSVADLSVASMFVNYAHAGCTPDPSRYPRIARWTANIHGRDSFAPIIARENAVIVRLREKAAK